MDFPDKKGLHLWFDLLKFEVEKSLKQRLVYSEKNGLQLWPGFLQIQVKKSLKQLWDFSDKKDFNHTQICLNLKLKYH